MPPVVTPSVELLRRSNDQPCHTIPHKPADSRLAPALPCSLLQPIGPRDGWPTGVTPVGISVRYTAQDIPISPWLAPATWTYTITQDSPWLAAVKDGVLDLSLQVGE